MSLERKTIRGRAIRPEQEVLLLLSRSRVRSQQEARVTALLQANLDWCALLADAIDSNVLQLVAWNLGHNPEWIPQEYSEFLKSYFERGTRRALLLTLELLDVLERFRRNGIEAIPYKGPVLAALAYKNIALRYFSDLDLLVRQHEVPKAAEILAEMGFRPEFDLDSLRPKKSRDVPGQYGFERGPGSSRMELHTERTLRYYPVLPRLECLRGRVIRVPIAGNEIQSFCPEDLLPILCVHGSKHFWEKLQWICDIAELIEIPGGFDWEISFEMAHQTRTEGMVLLGLQLAADLLGANVPEQLLEQAHRDSAVQSLANKACEGLLGSKNEASGLLSRFLFRWRMPERLSEKFRYIFRLATSPTETDREYAQFSNFFSPLYHVIRPIRLIRAYGFWFKRRPTPSNPAIYAPTPDAMVEKMLGMAALSSEDFLFDLGCGDSQIVITAAKKYGARAAGAESNPHRFRLAKANARRAGVELRTNFVQGDARSVDLREATVVFLYLSLAENLKLRKKLDEELPLGARVLSRDFEIPGWRPERTETYQATGSQRGQIYLYRKNAHLSGALSSGPASCQTVPVDSS
ncbi:MAG: nucleotidyltransferase family protein [Candidatus Acidiferrales bacterium]